MIQAIAARNPGNSHDQMEIANLSTRLSAQLIADTKADEAMPYLNRAIAILEKAQREDPQATLYGHFLTLSHVESAHALREMGKTALAMEHDESAIAIAERLSEADPKETEFRADAARAHQDLAETLLALQGVARTSQAMDEAKRATTTLSALESTPQDATLAANLGRALRVLGMVHMRAGELDAALASVRLSVTQLEKVAQRDPANLASQSELAWSLSAEGDCLARMGRNDKAADAYSRAVSLWREMKERNAITAIDVARASEVGARIAKAASSRK